MTPEEMKSEKLVGLIQAIGATSEMAIVFYRSVLSNGASTEEAVKLTQAFIAAVLYGNEGPRNQSSN